MSLVPWKRSPSASQLVAQLDVVVDLAVVDDPAAGPRRRTSAGGPAGLRSTIESRRWSSPTREARGVRRRAARAPGRVRAGRCANTSARRVGAAERQRARRPRDRSARAPSSSGPRWRISARHPVQPAEVGAPVRVPESRDPAHAPRLLSAQVPAGRRGGRARATAPRSRQQPEPPHRGRERQRDRATFTSDSRRRPAGASRCAATAERQRRARTAQRQPRAAVRQRVHALRRRRRSAPPDVT